MGTALTTIDSTVARGQMDQLSVGAGDLPAESGGRAAKTVEGLGVDRQAGLPVARRLRAAQELLVLSVVQPEPLEFDDYVRHSPPRSPQVGQKFLHFALDLETLADAKEVAVGRDRAKSPVVFPSLIRNRVRDQIRQGIHSAAEVGRIHGGTAAARRQASLGADLRRRPWRRRPDGVASLCAAHNGHGTTHRGQHGGPWQWRNGRDVRFRRNREHSAAHPAHPAHAAAHPSHSARVGHGRNDNIRWRIVGLRPLKIVGCNAWQAVAAVRPVSRLRDEVRDVVDLHNPELVALGLFRRGDPHDVGPDGPFQFQVTEHDAKR